MFPKPHAGICFLEIDLARRVPFFKVDRLSGVGSELLRKAEGVELSPWWRRRRVDGPIKRVVGGNMEG